MIGQPNSPPVGAIFSSLFLFLIRQDLLVEF
jgi:hypothetical protein